MKENLVLCAIAKCENKYIMEWVQWHFNIGFDKIVVYDNNDVDGEKISDVIDDVPCVEVIDWRGKTQKSCETQVAAYNDCYKKHMGSKWIMFLDIDEFLEFKEGMDLRKFVEHDWVKRANDIKFHWKCYSDNGYVHTPDGLVTENFTEECKNKAAVNCYVKHLYKCGLPKLNILNVHYSSSLTNVFYQNGKPAPYLTITVDKNINHDVGWIRHYVTKSMEEFVFTKYARRGPGTSKNRLNVDFYFKYNERTPEKERKLREMIAELEPSKKEELKPIVKQEKPKKESKTSWVIEPYYAHKSYPGKSKEQTKELELLHKNENEQDNYPGGISICISAWNVDKYIEECLDSIVSQHWIQKHDNYEILIGIDHCEKTLEKLKSIADKYKDYNLKVFMMDKNVGTYIVSNTLMKEAKYRWLLRFDSDDVMYYDMIEKLLKYALTENFDVLQPYAINFGSRTNPIFMNHGCVLMRKTVFEKFGGYRPWKCAADTELIIRLRKYAVCKKYERIVFKRRVHSENLTCRKDTGMKSDLRQQYKKQTVIPNSINKAIIRCVTASFTEIKLKEEPVNELNDNEQIDDVIYNGISVCITAYNVQDYIEECLDSVAAQTWFETHDNWEIIVGIDGCEKTLAKMKEIMCKYKNLRVLMMDSNKGTYVTSNTIMKEAKHELLLRFDGDDIMLPDMIDKGFSKKIKNNIVQFKFDSFGDTTLEKEQRDTPARGIIMIEKCMFEKLGGYRNWLCSGDSNLYERAKLLNYDIAVTDNTTFYRRLHKDSLCFNEKTRIKDKNSVRHQYMETTNNDVANNIYYVEPVYNSFKEIEYEKQQELEAFVVDRIDYDGFLKCKNKIHVLIVDFKQLQFTQHIISSLLVQDTSFDLTIFEQKPDDEAKRYFKKLEEEWDSSDCELNVILNSVNAPLNHVWNWFHEHTDNPYLAFLNNDIEICNNFISDAEQIFEKEEKCGIIIHPTNRPEYTKSYTLAYEKVEGYPILQGWDFILNRNAYSPIPDNLWIWRGDVYLMTNAHHNGWDEYYDISSPILHYTSSTVDTFKTEIQVILNRDKQHWKELDMKECTNREDNIYTHRLFNGIFPIDLTKKVIVSFTTWTKRISNVPGVVEMMMNQTKQPDLIILNLSYEEFKWRKRLLREVRALEKSNPIFKVNMVRGKNTTVWKKWLPIIDEYNNDLIIPIDDDIVYTNDFIERLYNKWLENPYNPITGDLVFLGGFLQAHCGAGSLIFRQAFGIYMNDYKKIVDELCASDVFYSFAAYMNGYKYIKEGMNVLKFGRHDEIAPYSHAKNKTIPKQPQLMDMDFLTDYYLKYTT